MSLRFLRLPIDADEGFPQSFRMSLADRTYLMTLYVNVTDDALLDSPEPLVLPRPGAFLVIEVAREDGRGPVSVLRRKAVPGLEYEAAELAIIFTSIAVHPRNLNAAGAFGSEVIGGVAVRWAS